MALAVTFIDEVPLTDNLTTYDFGNFTIGSSGLLVAGLSARSGSALSFDSISIDGGAATLIDFGNSASDTNLLGLAAREVSSGSRNVSFTLNTGGLRAHAGVWLVTDYDSATPYDTDKSEGVANPTMTMNYHGDGGVGIYVLMNQFTAGSTSWGTATGRYDEVIEFIRASGADRSASGDAVDEVVDANNSNTICLSASWAPSGGDPDPTPSPYPYAIVI